METKIHPASTVSNIKSFIPITLEMDTGHYTSWCELFKIHCRVFQVHDHLSPKPPTDSSSTSNETNKDKTPKPVDDSWDRIDAIVLQWIYGTISTDLLHTILQPNTTAHEAWKALENIFQDNKSARSIHLRHKFSNTRLDGFPNISAYCQQLKMLADQLANVGSPVDNTSLVLQLISGLTEQYEGIATILQNQDPLPSFYEARSKLIMVETRKAENALHSSQTAGTALNANTSRTSTNQGPPPSDQMTERHRTRGRSRGRGRGRFSWGRGRQFSTGYQPQHICPHPNYPSWATTQQWAAPHQTSWQQWAAPPCPYPTINLRPNNNNNNSNGLLGPRPNQAHHTAYAPTDIEQALYTMSLHQPDPTLYMDTGATTTMTNTQGNFQSFVYNNSPQNIIVGDGSTIPVIGHGTQTLPAPFPPLLLKDVLYAPKLIKNLISVRRFTTDNSVSVEFDPFGFLVKDYKTRIPILRCNSSGDLYPLLLGSATTTTPSAFTAISSQLWHQRLGHPGQPLMQSLKQSRSIAFERLNKNICQSCVFGKSIKLPFANSHTHIFQPFDIIHSDLWTSPIISSGGHRYYILFLDDLTNFLWTFPIAKKSQVYNIFCHFHKYIETQFEKKIKTLQCDNGREYVNSSFHQFFHHHGMTFRLSCPHTSSQNGKAERKIRTINNMVRTLLAHASLPNYFWDHALDTATYLLNILPNKQQDNQTPTELLYSRIPSYDHLRVFGCLCYPLVPSPTIHKLQNRSHPCVFLGYPSTHRGYKCFNLQTKQIHISRHVVFDETTFPFANTPPPLPTYDFLTSNLSPLLWPMVQPQTQPTNNLAHTHHPSPTHSPIPPSSPMNQPIPTHHSPATTQLHPTPSHTQTNTVAQTPPPDPPSTSHNSFPTTSSPQSHLDHPSTSTAHPARTMRTRAMDGIVKPKQRLNLHTSTNSTILPIPKNPSDALSIPEWHKAMTNEFEALIKNETWELVPRQPHMNIIRSMWLFKHKFRSDGTLERYKARLVCDGRLQQVGIDCGDTFSPVVKPATIRTVLSIALSQSWAVHQLDVTNAFLHGTLHETVYMYQPMGFRHRTLPDHVCRLKKSLYGLKQAPRAWYQRFTDYVLTLGFHQSKCDASLFTLRNGCHIAHLLLYVDDILLITSSDHLRHQLMTHLAAEFAMKDLGPLSFFLGISVSRQKDSMFLSQQSYANDIITRAGMQSCNPVTTPVDTHAKLSTTSGDDFHDPTLYRSLAGALQYLTFTRPDISYAVQQICIHMHAPKTDHWNALKRIIRYIKGTTAYGLTLGPSTDPSLVAYTDADWAGCPDTRRSTSGYCVYYGGNLISWSSKRQPTISRSSAEAEYRGVANVVAEICWLRNLLLELRRPLSCATLVYCDNVSTIYLTGNPVQHQRTKHIELDIHFVREQVQRGQVRVLHVPSRYQIADIFTKGLPRILFDDFRSSLNIRSPPDSTAGV